jgi:hypothetical protein
VPCSEAGGLPERDVFLDCSQLVSSRPSLGSSCAPESCPSLTFGPFPLKPALFVAQLKSVFALLRGIMSAAPAFCYRAVPTVYLSILARTHFDNLDPN